MIQPAALVLLLGAALAAPLPVKEVPPAEPFAVRVGSCDHTWGGMPFRAHFLGNGDWRCNTSSQFWAGSYDWDPVTRTLTVDETCGTCRLRWHVVLDGKGEGTTDGDVTVFVSFSPVSPPK